MNDNPMHYCPGCSHGVVHKLIAEVIEEMGMEDKTVGISPVGCAVFAYNYLDIDWQEAAHGRAPAVATAVKRLWPDRLVFTYHACCPKKLIEHEWQSLDEYSLKLTKRHRLARSR